MLTQHVRPAAHPPAPTRTSAGRLNLPLKLGAAWLGGTYLMFLSVGQVSRVEQLWKLSFFVGATIVMFVLGYWLKARTYTTRLNEAVPPETTVELRSARRLILISAGYFAVYGLALLAQYGATDPGVIVQAILHPGAAYFSKFAVYAQQQATGDRDPVVQILTLLGVLYTPLVPFAILYWGHLTVVIRTAVLGGVGLYCAFFLFIGTMKGLGDLLVFALTGLLVLVFGKWRITRKPLPVKRAVAAALLLLCGFVGYMAYNQAQRLTVVGISDQFKPNPVIASVTSENFARGIAAVAFYPTHGYLGLSYNLDTPFTWSKGLGSSVALNSYWVQYIGGQGVGDNTYPARTEVRTGWPQGQFWATIYPWLASDLTFPGAAAFMGVVGWWLARFWYEAAYQRSRLAVLMLCQLTLLLAYVPANNQIGIGRPSLIGFVSLAVLYAANRVRMPNRQPRGR